MADKTTNELLASLKAVIAAWDRHYLPLQSPGAEADHNGPIYQARQLVGQVEFDLLTDAKAAEQQAAEQQAAEQQAPRPTEHDFRTVEGRRAALAALGPEEYARAHDRYRERQVVAVVNGYKIRCVPSRWGAHSLYYVIGLLGTMGLGHNTQAGAETLARSLPAGPYSSGEA